MFSLIPWMKRGGDKKLTTPHHSPNDLHTVARLRSELDSLWDRFWADTSRSLGPWAGDLGFGARDSIEDRDSEYVYHVDLPGFEPEEIGIEVSGSTLRVKAEHREQQRGDQRSACRYGSFQRQISLPHGVDDQQIEARYHSGVLELRLPKTEEAKGRRVPVKAH